MKSITPQYVDAPRADPYRQALYNSVQVQYSKRDNKGFGSIQGNNIRPWNAWANNAVLEALGTAYSKSRTSPTFQAKIGEDLRICSAVRTASAPLLSGLFAGDSHHGKSCSLGEVMFAKLYWCSALITKS